MNKKQPGARGPLRIRTKNINAATNAGSFTNTFSTNKSKK